MTCFCTCSNMRCGYKLPSHAHNMADFKVLFVVLLIFLAAVVSEGTLSKSDKKKKKKIKEITPDENAASEAALKTVSERGLVSANVKYADIIKNHKLYSTNSASKRQLPETMMSLGYVTPWNNHGYDTAKWFANKFTHISPVWLQIKPARQMFEMTGIHDIDQGWIEEVRNGGKEGGGGVKIVPRLLFEGWTMNDYQELFSSESKRLKLAVFITEQIANYRFDGAVLEIWSQLGGHYKSELSDVIKRISKQFHKFNLQLILVIPSTKEGSALFGPKDYQRLLNDVDGFSLMTYDYSTPQSPGPVAPLHWVEDCIKELTGSSKRNKLLVGINFYGYDFGPSGMDAVVGNRYVELLSNYKPKIEWDDHCSEHYFNYKTAGGMRHLVYYPSLKSMQERLQLMTELGTGLSIWEIGQGLDYFFDLL
ncbi:PREDICTED: chitinase domain-containing protein 1-like [Amphimedon queenslandica]|uniref:Chitinase domain-containing protein 1 n=2 Tax=Amphimedon queenslandica TaxID=400682 RepID=A0AAN0I907_AMPQE|nr:PREDICTED: chitinase domain-containing protein 1-like [Amphimedon queenslandica]|eukprot:XP_003382825.2 PREDICTED: chitinase domain-containing protein 1-like [Amphimedon queenslandica]